MKCENMRGTTGGLLPGRNTENTVLGKVTQDQGELIQSHDACEEKAVQCAIHCPV